MRIELAKISVSEYLRAKSKGTADTYLIYLNKYFQIIYPELALEWTPIRRKKDQQQPYWDKLDELSLQYLDSNRNLRKDLLDYKEAIKDYAPKTRGVQLSSVIGFFEDNGIQIPSRLKKDLFGRNKSAVSEEYIPIADDIRKVLEHLTLPEKTLVLLLCSSGMRVGEAMKLKPDMIDFEHDPVLLRLPAKITKNKRKRITFISYEASATLQQWLDYRLEFARNAARRKSDYEFDPDDDRLFPFSYSNFVIKWNNACEKAGYDKVDTKTMHDRRVFRVHNLRKFFRTRGGWTNPEIAESLLGHVAGMKAIYARMDQAVDILVEGYLEALPNLCVYENSKSMLELQTRVEEQSEDIKDLVEDLTLRNNRLEDQLTQMSQSMKTYASMSDELDQRYRDTIMELMDKVNYLEGCITSN